MLLWALLVSCLLLLACARDDGNMHNDKEIDFVKEYLEHLGPMLGNRDHTVNLQFHRKYLYVGVTCRFWGETHPQHANGLHEATLMHMKDHHKSRDMRYEEVEVFHHPEPDGHELFARWVLRGHYQGKYEDRKGAGIFQINKHGYISHYHESYYPHTIMEWEEEGFHFVDEEVDGEDEEFDVSKMDDEQKMLHEYVIQHKKERKELAEIKKQMAMLEAKQKKIHEARQKRKNEKWEL